MTSPRATTGAIWASLKFKARLQRWRSYSIASAPDGSNILELCIARSSEGNGSRYLFESVNEGSELRFKGPEGGFVLPDVIEKDLVFICTGTGIAPFRAFMQQRAADEAPGKNWLFFGNPHFTEDFLYQVEWQRYVKEGVLTRIDLAWSRDQKEKVYVQDKLREQGAVQA